MSIKRTSVAVVGMQWGDEGKGKVIDLLSEKASHVARVQGEPHTVIVGGKQHTFHWIPSGILHPQTKCYIGGGAAIDPAALLAEIEGLAHHEVGNVKRLYISLYAHLMFPWHEGIGDCHRDRVSGHGIRFGDLLHAETFRERLQEVASLKQWEDHEAIFAEYSEYAERLRPFTAPVEEILSAAHKRQENILLEGTLGALLDNTFGTDSFASSSCTLASGLCSGLGIGPSRIDHVIGVAKAYMTRAGDGPMPTEWPDQGRKGWLDAALLKHAVSLNGVDSLALMQLDALDQMEEIKICVGYKHCKTFPATAKELAAARPIYETHPGWKQDTSNVRIYDDLPSHAKAYIRRIEELCETNVSLVSVGPDREKTLWLDRFFEAGA